MTARFTANMNHKVVGCEMIALLASTGNAFHVEGRGAVRNRMRNSITLTGSPRTSNVSLRDYSRINRSGKAISNERTELVPYPRR